MLNYKITIKKQVIIFLTLFAIYLAIRNNEFRFLITTLIAVATASAVESIIILLKNKNFTITDSSIISGLIVGYVLAPDNPWWVFCATSSFAILSKQLLRINSKHIFNPAAFGILCSTIAFNASLQWAGTYIWYILLPFGIYFAYKTNKNEILFGYFLTSFVLLIAIAMLHHINFINLLGYFSYFYIFIMVIEPKTSPAFLKAKWIFGIGIAMLVFIFNQTGIRYDAELSGLLILNIFTQLLNKIENKLPFRRTTL